MYVFQILNTNTCWRLCVLFVHITCQDGISCSSLHKAMDAAVEAVPLPPLSSLSLSLLPGVCLASQLASLSPSIYKYVILI